MFKEYMDRYRGTLPPELKGKIPGILYTKMDTLNRWRNWRSGMVWEDKENQITLVGAIDDLLVMDDGSFAPFDCKTKGSEPKDNGAQYYQTQLDCYNLMLDAQNMKTSDQGWLAYYWPEAIVPADLIGNRVIGIKFKFQEYKLACSKQRAIELCRKAAECLRGPRPSNPEPENEYWTYVEGKKQLSSGVGV